MDAQLDILYLETLQRYPTSSEITLYLSDLNSSNITLSQIRNNIYSSVEYLTLNNQYFGETNYDSSTYTITLSNIVENNYNGVIIANGKLGLVSSGTHNKMESSFITTKFDFNHLGQYTNNIVDGWKYTQLNFFNFNEANTISSNLIQNLNMYNATFTSEYDIIFNSSNLHVKQDVSALQQYPYCLLHKYTLSNYQNYDLNLDFYHIVECDRNISKTNYATNLINVNNTNTYLFSAEGFDDDKNIEIDNNNCYLFNSNYTYSHKGYNINRLNTRLAYNKFNVVIPALSEIDFSIISSMMTTNDFERPLIELNRILLNVAAKSSSTIKTEHVNKWTDIWKSDIILTEKSDNTTTESEKVLKMKQHIKYALYNIYSVIREDINVEINPLNLSAIDLTGHIFWNAELWLVPVLLFIKPKAAKTLLDYRYHQLENARKLAIAHGFKGGKFPYENDVVAYTDVYWDTISPLYIFNSGVIAVNTWNYFRITRDLDWLRSKGYKILKNTADFFESSMDNGSIKNVYSLNNSKNDNNSLTNYFALLSLKFAIEATYELNYKVDQRWLTAYDSLKTSFPIFANVDITETITAPTDIVVKLAEQNGQYSYNFIDYTTSNLIGYQFGGDSGFSLKMSSGTNYTFHLDSNLTDYPLAFYDYSENALTTNTGTALQNDDGFYNGTFIEDGGNLRSYRHVFGESNYSIVHGEINSTFGSNAFTLNDNITTLGNIVKLHDTYNGENIKYLESHMLLMGFYSKIFLQIHSLQNGIDLIRDNITYYNRRIDSDYENNIFNKLVISILEATLAQEEQLYTYKKTAATSYDNNIHNILNDSTLGPWGNFYDNIQNSPPKYNSIAFSSMFIFSIVTALAAMRVTGSINNERFYTEEFGIKSRTGYVMPKTWKSLKLTNIGVNGTDYTINNVLYNDSPL